MQLLRIISLLSLLFFIRRTLSETIVRSPVDMVADVGVWANFTCSVSCNHLINWFVGGYPSDISTLCTDTRNDLMVCKETTHQCSSTPGATNNTETLKVLAKSEHAGSNITVQCVAVSRTFNTNSCNPFFTYSRFALLTVNDLPVPSPTPCISPPPAANVTITEVVTVTETQPRETVTVTTTSVSTTTKTETVTVAETPGVTSPPLPAPNSVTDSRRQFGKLVTELFMWVFTIAAGLLFARAAVLL